MITFLLIPFLHLLLATLTLVDGQFTPRCDETVISKIKDYHAENGYPPSMAVGSKTWMVKEYSVPLKLICVKQEIGEGEVISTLSFSLTGTVLYKNSVTFKGDVQKGLVVQTVNGTNELIHLWILKSHKGINVFHVCDPTSKNTLLGHQGGIALPMGKKEDEATKEEVKAMKKVLADIGIKTYSYPICKG